MVDVKIPFKTIEESLVMLKKFDTVFPCTVKYTVELAEYIISEDKFNKIEEILYCDRFEGDYAKLKIILNKNYEKLLWQQESWISVDRNIFVLEIKKGINNEITPVYGQRCPPKNNMNIKITFKTLEECIIMLKKLDIKSTYNDKIYVKIVFIADQYDIIEKTYSKFLLSYSDIFYQGNSQAAYHEVKRRLSLYLNGFVAGDFYLNYNTKHFVLHIENNNWMYKI